MILFMSVSSPPSRKFASLDRENRAAEGFGNGTLDPVTPLGIGQGGSDFWAKERDTEFTELLSSSVF